MSFFPPTEQLTLQKLLNSGYFTKLPNPSSWVRSICKLLLELSGVAAKKSPNLRSYECCMFWDYILPIP